MARLTPRVRVVEWAVLGGALLAVGLGIWLGGVAAGADPFDRSLIYRTATISIAVAGLLAVLSCLAWYLLPQDRRSATNVPSTSV
jgi:hypothetical protein